MSDDETDESEEEYIVEFFKLGNTVKVTAMNPHTLKEVSIVGSPKVSKRELAQLAIRKLKYITTRDSSQ